MISFSEMLLWLCTTLRIKYRFLYKTLHLGLLLPVLSLFLAPLCTWSVHDQ